MPLADLEARRAYDRDRAKAKNKGGSCEICGSSLPDGRRKLCGSPDCRRKYKTQKQRIYNLSPGARERRREYDQARMAGRKGTRNSWEWNLWHVHGMRPEQWHALYVEQGGLCYLGKHPLPENRRLIVVDHDHGHCGPTRSCSICRRGLACSNCNTIIGLAGEDPKRLKTIADSLVLQRSITTALILAAPKQLELHNYAAQPD